MTRSEQFCRKAGLNFLTYVPYSGLVIASLLIGSVVAVAFSDDPGPRMLACLRWSGLLYLVGVIVAALTIRACGKLDENDSAEEIWGVLLIGGLMWPALWIVTSRLEKERPEIWLVNIFKASDFWIFDYWKERRERKEEQEAERKQNLLRTSLNESFEPENSPPSSPSKAS